MTGTLRRHWLFLRSRSAARAALWLVASAVVAWALLRASDDRAVIKLVLIILPLAPAVIIGAGQYSPFGELEQTASHMLPALRLAQMVVLLALAGGTLAAANSAAGGEDFRWLLVRNGAGYAGIALLGGRLTGASLSWLPPLAYGMFVLVAPLGALLERESRWLWPIQPPVERPAGAIAVALLVVGLAVASCLGARITTDEVA